jgi:hypothetical protein
VTAPPWGAVRALFEHALALGEAERAALLADPALEAALVAEVRSLLAHEVRECVDTFLSMPAALTAAPEVGREGQLLGAWRG